MEPQMNPQKCSIPIPPTFLHQEVVTAHYHNYYCSLPFTGGSFSDDGFTLRMGSISCSGPYVKPDIGSLLPQALCHPYPSLSCRQGTIVDQRGSWLGVYVSPLVENFPVPKTLECRREGYM